MIAPRYVEDNPNMLRHRDKYVKLIPDRLDKLTNVCILITFRCFADHKAKLAKIQGKREFETKVQKQT